MKAVEARVTRGLNIGSRLKVADNSGANIIQIIGVKKYRGVKNRYPRAGVGDLVICAVKQGKPEMKHKVVPALIIRQKKPFKRSEGMRVCFEDNAAIILKDIKEADPKGTTIKGPVAKEVIQRFKKVGKIARLIL